jgi:2,3-bisphosphoglycerate-dependent phosphoglycerate mutase
MTLARYLCLSCFTLFINVHCFSQDDQITTFILVRHAEKESDGTKDPSLSTSGKERARKLAALLEETSVDAIYSTDYKRTRETAMPLAEAKQLQIQFYEPQKAPVIDEMITKYGGRTIVIIGHSNTIPWTANYLAGKELYPNFADDDHNDVLIVTYAGKGNAKVTRLNY